MKTRVQIFLLATFMIFAAVAETISNQMVSSQAITPNKSVNNAKDERSKANKRECPATKPCRERPRNPFTGISIINPSTGYLRDKKPLLSWSKVPDVEKYIVRLQEVGQVPIWEFQVNSTETPYPANKPLLEANKDYELVVETSVNGELKKGSVIFRLLPEAERIELEKKEQEIKKLILNPDERTLRLAELYREKQLLTDAILVLRKSPNVVPIYLMLGELYLQAELPDLADNSYQQALNIAKNFKDKAEAQFGLGRANDKQKKLQLAIKWLTEAHTSYVSLGELEKSIEIARYLGEIHEENSQRKEAIGWYQKARDGYKELGDKEGQKYMETKLRKLS